MQTQDERLIMSFGKTGQGKCLKLLKEYLNEYAQGSVEMGY